MVREDSRFKKKRDKLEKMIGRILLRHKELDNDENAKRKQKPFKKTMGEDLERRTRHIERLEKKLKRLDSFLENAKPRIGISNEEVKSNITDNESGLIKSAHGYVQGYNGVGIADSGNQVIICAETIGSVAESGCFSEMLDSLEENMKKISRKKEPLKKALLTGDTGLFSEDNLQEAAKRGIEVLIPDPQFRQRDPYFAEKKAEKVPVKKRFTVEDFVYNKETDSYMCPCGKNLEYKGKAELRNNMGKKYQAKSSDCIRCDLINQCIKPRKGKKELVAENDKKEKKRNHFRTLYIADLKYDENLSEKMRKKIDDPAYRELYSRRMQIIEPVFSNITYCKGMDRFTLRTQKKVNIQWLLFCIVHNMGKCMNKLRQKYDS